MASGWGLEGEDQALRDHVFAEFPSSGSMMTMVRSRDWKLVDFGDKPYGQVFNMAEDPNEVNNLWDDSTGQKKAQELRDVMRNWLVESNLKTCGWQAGWR